MENKEIYIVFRSDYEETTVLGVFENENKAKRIVEINPKYYSYKNYVVNQMTDEGIYEIIEYIKDLKEDLGVE